MRICVSIPIVRNIALSNRLKNPLFQAHKSFCDTYEICFHYSSLKSLSFKFFADLVERHCRCRAVRKALYILLNGFDIISSLLKCLHFPFALFRKELSDQDNILT